METPNTYDDREMIPLGDTIKYLFCIILFISTIVLANKLDNKNNEITELQSSYDQQRSELVDALLTTDRAKFEYTEILEDMCMNAHYQYIVETIEVDGQYLKYITIYSESP